MGSDEAIGLVLPCAIIRNGSLHSGQQESWYIISIFRICPLLYIFSQGAVPTAFNAWLPIEPFMHCVNLTSPKVLMLDSERLTLLNPHLRDLPTSVILVRPSSSKLLAGSRVREWSSAMASYTGSNTAWEKEPECLPDENATVSRIRILQIPSPSPKPRYFSHQERLGCPRAFCRLNVAFLEIASIVCSEPAEENLEGVLIVSRLSQI
jgi:hypothetical protein